MDVNLPEELIDAYLDGELDEAGATQLNAWLAAEEANVRVFVRRIFVHHQLRESMLAQNVNETLLVGLHPDNEASTLTDASTSAGHSRFHFKQSMPLLAAALSGILVGSLATWQLAYRHEDQSPLSVVDAPRAPQVRPDGANPYVATLVNVTNCRWDEVRSTANLQIGSSLRPGESLHLLEGVAQIQTMTSSGATTVQLEGPAAMSLTSEGMPSLLYGKLTASFSSKSDQFALDTPLGRVIVSSNASIGVASAPNQVEMHVFSGAATLEVWGGGMKDAPTMTAESGSSLRAHVENGGEVAVDRGDARENWFVTPAALAKSRLAISPQYVEAVRQANPLAYWRFETSDGGVMRNEVADRLHCRMVGDAVRWRPNHENGSAEFGVTAGPGYLISDDVVDIERDYTLEAWVKPTYFHHGALFSLIDWVPSRSPQGSHRLHLELCGPLSGFAEPFRPTEFNPGRVRFIHQNSECFSSTPYAVRRWQHLAAVKEAAHVRLYSDGELVAKYEDNRNLGLSLHVLMGQLFPESPYIDDQVTSRLFVGEMDEVALYNHALSESDLALRVELAVRDNPAEPSAPGESF